MDQHSPEMLAWITLRSIAYIREVSAILFIGYVPPKRDIKNKKFENALVFEGFNI
jgi:hypothetical protein